MLLMMMMMPTIQPPQANLQKSSQGSASTSIDWKHHYDDYEDFDDHFHKDFDDHFHEDFDDYFHEDFDDYLHEDFDDHHDEYDDE